MPESPQKPRDLAAVVTSVIDHMQNQLPERLTIRVALGVLIGDFGAGGRIGKRQRPLPPSLVQSRPVVLEYRQMIVGIGSEGGGRLVGHTGQPDAIRGVNVDQGTEHAAIGRFEIVSQVVLRKLRRCANQTLTGPARVIEVSSENVR